LKQSIEIVDSEPQAKSLMTSAPRSPWAEAMQAHSSLREAIVESRRSPVSREWSERGRKPAYGETFTQERNEES
jgi:hypothetical protein